MHENTAPEIAPAALKPQIQPENGGFNRSQPRRSGRARHRGRESLRPPRQSITVQTKSQHCTTRRRRTQPCVTSRCHGDKVCRTCVNNCQPGEARRSRPRPPTRHWGFGCPASRFATQSSRRFETYRWPRWRCLNRRRQHCSMIRRGIRS